jgi:hypothetical protein
VYRRSARQNRACVSANAVTGCGRPIPIDVSVTERLRHVHVLGRTGTGKSSVLAGIAHALASRGEGALVADLHGQLCNRILVEFPDPARDRVWWIRCGASTTRCRSTCWLRSTRSAAISR